MLITPVVMLSLLIGPLLVGRLLSHFRAGRAGNLEHWGRAGIALLFCFTGAGHFVLAEPMAKMLPPWVPSRVPLVYATGLIEIGAALCVMMPRLRVFTGWALIVMLLLFLPVNVYAAINRVGLGGHELGPIYLLMRVPLQAILIGWIAWFAVRSARHPIRFRCEATLAIAPEEICAQILDLSRWPDFTGYGVLPGIAAADFEARTDDVVGTRIRVRNTDGSSHVEQVTEWDPQRRVRLSMHEFSPPLCRFASHFEEIWAFERRDGRTKVSRSFELHPVSGLTRPALWLISRLLRRAVARHLQDLASESSSQGSKA